MSDDWYIANIRSVALVVWLAFMIGTLTGVGLVLWLGGRP